MSKKGVPAKFNKYVRWFWMLLILPVVVLLFVIFLVATGALGDLPKFEELENPKSNLATVVYSSDMKVLGKFFVENRTTTKYKELSPYLVDALIATEDARFYDHSGVDGRGLVRVLLRTIIGGDESGGGGSTISQQLAKNLFPREANMNVFEKFTRKIKEWVIAAKLEKQYTKEEILTMYLNTFDFINNAVGIRSAAKIYFNTTPDSLKLEQAAMLVGMAKNPSLFNPIRRLKNATQRRNVVMNQMVKYNYISEAKYDSLKVLPLSTDFNPDDHNDGLATYFREYLRDVFLKKWCEENRKPDGSKFDIYRDGLKIYTTIDSRLQRYAEQAQAQHMKKLQQRFVQLEGKKKSFPFVGHVTADEVKNIMASAMKQSDRYRSLKHAGYSEAEITKNFRTKDTMRVFSWKGDRDTVMTPMDSIRYYKSFLQNGFMSMEPKTGYIKAWVGGINHKHFKYDHVKVGTRQVGSTFKPFVYLLAIQEGWSPCMRVPNVPVTIHYDDKEWTPRNSSSEKLNGKMLTLKYALAQSVNYVTAYIMKSFGPQAVVTVTKRLGITTKIDPFPSICLGTADISVFEMVGAYSTFANKGTWIEPTFVTHIEDKNGKVLQEFIPKKVEVMDEEKAYIMLELLKGVTLYGTGAGLRSGDFKLTTAIAGKTGTTQNNADGWFMGITPDLVSGTWVGGEDRCTHFTNMLEGQGATMALPVWGLYMKRAYADKTLKISQKDFDRPAKQLTIEMDCSRYEKDIEKNTNQNIDPENDKFDK